MKNLSILSICFACSFAAHAQLPSPTDVMQPRESTSTEIDSRVVINEFKLAYQEAGSPKLTVLWNSKFTAQVSDWENAPIQRAHVETLQFDSKTESIDAKYQHADKVISRKLETDRFMPRELDLETFKTKFIESLLLANVNLIDNSTIIRLHAAKASDSSKMYELDGKLIETEAYLNFTDLIVELLFVPSSSHPLGFYASAEVKEIETGQIIAKVKSDKPNISEKFIATKHGFKLVQEEDSSISFEDLASNLALKAMDKLSETISK